MNWTLTTIFERFNEGSPDRLVAKSKNGLKLYNSLGHCKGGLIKFTVLDEEKNKVKELKAFDLVEAIELLNKEGVY